MNAGALLLGGCDALIGFLHKEITTELMKSVCFRSGSAGYTQTIPVATNFRDPRLAMPSSSTVVSKIVLFAYPYRAHTTLDDPFGQDRLKSVPRQSSSYCCSRGVRWFDQLDGAGLLRASQLAYPFLSKPVQFAPRTLIMRSNDDSPVLNLLRSLPSRCPSDTENEGWPGLRSLCN